MKAKKHRALIKLFVKPNDRLRQLEIGVNYKNQLKYHIFMVEDKGKLIMSVTLKNNICLTRRQFYQSLQDTESMLYKSTLMQSECGLQWRENWYLKITVNYCCQLSSCNHLIFTDADISQHVSIQRLFCWYGKTNVGHINNIFSII